MQNPFLRDIGCYARHLRPYLERFPAENVFVVHSTRSAARPTKYAAASTNSSTSTPTSNRSSNQAKTKPAPRAFPSSNPAPNESTKESPRYRLWANS